ncbi:hypothetical protein H2198_003838 [Neophaeococcomyces mojaviensis]|uniref:Uncharacterized protein n=1 Tax=Neophaeococcomyces mojaviensis TaxID=3383035 RepID=A0ACC3AAR5_9EURO|nr:hypothetical protein H2198_003838 [Knufia sp. JES_112]
MATEPSERLSRAAHGRQQQPAQLDELTEACDLPPSDAHDPSRQQQPDYTSSAGDPTCLDAGVEDGYSSRSAGSENNQSNPSSSSELQPEVIHVKQEKYSSNPGPVFQSQYPFSITISDDQSVEDKIEDRQLLALRILIPQVRKRQFRIPHLGTSFGAEYFAVGPVGLGQRMHNSKQAIDINMAFDGGSSHPRKSQA